MSRPSFRWRPYPSHRSDSSYDLITLTDHFFQYLAVQDLDVPAGVTNRPRILQVTSSDGDAFAALRISENYLLL